MNRINLETASLKEIYTAWEKDWTDSANRWDESVEMYKEDGNIIMMEYCKKNRAMCRRQATRYRKKLNNL